MKIINRMTVNIALNKQARLSEHFTLGELCKTSVNSLDGNIPSHEDIENLKRLCPWLEELRYRYNQRYVSLPLQGEMEEVTKPGRERPPLTPPVGGGPEEPVIITSGYRSPVVNKCVGGVYSSNHLTGCAVDIRCTGVEQAIRYAAILLDMADDRREDFDELFVERNRKGRYWVHFAVRPKDNRRKILFLDKR
jgi:hypothetical protein